MKIFKHPDNKIEFMTELEDGIHIDMAGRISWLKDRKLHNEYAIGDAIYYDVYYLDDKEIFYSDTDKKVHRKRIANVLREYKKQNK